MKNPWIILFSITFISALIFLFFFLQLRPVYVPEKAENEDIVVDEIKEPSVHFVNPKKGSETPLITLVEYADFLCTSCRTFAESIEVLLRVDTEVQVVWKNMPNEGMHELATPAAIAAQCAHNQGKFWEYHDLLLERQVVLTEDLFTQIATELTLDIPSFEKCYNRRETLPLIKQDYEEGLRLGITATPTVFIGEDRLVGSYTPEELLDYVEKAKQELNYDSE